MVPGFRCSSYATNRRHLTEQRRRSSTVSDFSHTRRIHLFSFPAEGYGGFGISIDPFFSSTILTFLQHYGAILAVPNIRGGNEFGEDWHNAGTKERKVGYIMPASWFSFMTHFSSITASMILSLPRTCFICPWFQCLLMPSIPGNILWKTTMRLQTRSPSTEVQTVVINPIRFDGTELVISIYIRFTRSGLRESCTWRHLWMCPGWSRRARYAQGMIFQLIFIHNLVWPDFV